MQNNSKYTQLNKAFLILAIIIFGIILKIFLFKNTQAGIDQVFYINWFQDLKNTDHFFHLNNKPFIYPLISKGSYCNKLILDLNNKFNLISTPIAYLNEIEGINNAGDIVKISNIL